jgi:hypothetical protein
LFPAAGLPLVGFSTIFPGNDFAPRSSYFDSEVLLDPLEV